MAAFFTAYSGKIFDLAAIFGISSDILKVTPRFEAVSGLLSRSLHFPTSNMGKKMKDADSAFDEIKQALDTDRKCIAVAERGSQFSLSGPSALHLSFAEPVTQIYGSTLASLGQQVRYLKFHGVQELPDWLSIVGARRELDELFSHKRFGRLRSGVALVMGADESNLRTEILLQMLRRAEQRHGLADARLLLCASLESEAKRLSSLVDAPIVTLERLPRHPIQTKVFPLKAHEHHSEGVARATQTVMERFLNGSLTANGKRIDSGTVVVFALGKAEAWKVIHRIEAVMLDRNCHARFSVLQPQRENLEAAIELLEQPSAAGCLRLVIGNQALQTLVEPDDAVCVIDCLEKRQVTADSRGIAEMRKHPLNVASSERRLSLLGLRSPGLYIPIGSYAQLSDSSEPEISRAPLESLALRLANIRDDVTRIAGTAEVSLERCKVAKARLQKLALLDEYEELTEAGLAATSRFAAATRPADAASLIHAEKKGVLREVAVVIAAIGKSGFIRRPPDPSRSERSYKFYQRRMTSWAKETCSDFYVLIAAFRRYERAAVSRTREELETWCRQNMISFRTIQRVEKSARHLLQKVDRVEQEQPILISVSPRAPGLVSNLVSESLLAGSLDEVGRKLDGSAYWSYMGQAKLVQESVCPYGKPFVVYRRVVRRNVGRKRTKMERQIRFAAPVSPDWFSRLLPTAVEQSVRGGAYYDAEQDKVLQATTTRFGSGITIAEQSVEVPDAIARKQLAKHLLKSSGTLPEKIARVLAENDLIRQRSITGSRLIGEPLIENQDDSRYREWLESRLSAFGAVRLGDLPDPEVLSLSALPALTSFLARFSKENRNQRNAGNGLRLRGD